MSIRLRPATPADAAYLLQLEETCMRGYAEALWGCWEPADTPATLNVAGHHIIEREGVAVGCVVETWEANHLYLDSLYIDAPFQSQGIGSRVLRMKVAEAAAKGLPTTLSVLATNPTAVEFYRREGFEVVAETTERRKMSKAMTADDINRLDLQGG